MHEYINLKLQQITRLQIRNKRNIRNTMVVIKIVPQSDLEKGKDSYNESENCNTVKTRLI